MTALWVSRASTDISRDETYFKTVFGLSSSNFGTYSVSWWENYQNGVNSKYMTKASCGWPLTGDNHNAFDWQFGFDGKNMVAGMKELGLPYFCKTGQRGGSMCYLTTPYGYQIQLDGTYSNPPTYYSYPGSLCATYQEYC